MRLFVALDLPDAVRQRLAAWRPALPVRWTPAERLHLTLRFLGETGDDSLDAITDQLARLDAPPVPLRTGALVALPSSHRPHVLALRVDDSTALARVHGAVERALAGAGIAPDARPLLPHITLARVRPGDGSRIVPEIAPLCPPVVRGTATTVSLVQSEPGPGGPVYTARLRVALR